MRIKSKILVAVEYAAKAEQKRKAENLSNEQTIAWFIQEMKKNGVNSNNWLTVDDEIRKNHELENWFWIIRRIRNDGLLT